MDVMLGSDDDFVFSVGETLVDMCASADEYAAMHERLSVKTVLTLGSTLSLSCSSDIMSERRTICDRATMALRDRHIDPSEVPDDDSAAVAIFQISIGEPKSGSQSERALRRRLLHDGLRHIVNAWGRHRDRLVISSEHEAEDSGDDDNLLLEDHMHIMYERSPEYGSNWLQDEISDFVEENLSWDAVARSIRNARIGK